MSAYSDASQKKLQKWFDALLRYVDGLREYDNISAHSTKKIFNFFLNVKNYSSTLLV